MNGHVITPHAGFHYTHISGDTYTQASTLPGLRGLIKIDSTDVALGILGVRYHTEIKAGNGSSIKPELRAGMSYDFASDEGRTTTTLPGTAPLSVKGADVAGLGGTVGLGLAFTSADSRWTLGAAYDADFKADYLGHTGQITAKLNF